MSEIRRRLLRKKRAAIRNRWTGLLVLACATALPAQQPVSPTLDQVLTAVQSNFDAYLKSVPNLLADEHVFSTVSKGTFQHEDTRTDSIFRLKRVPADDANPNGLSESREIRLVNGRPAQQDDLSGPTVLSGIFSTGQQDFAPDLKDCFDYELQLNQNLKPNPKAKKMRVIVIDLALKPGAARNKSCPITEPVTGRALIDPKTMQILSVEERLPDHEVYQGQHGVWTWSVQYAAVRLGGKDFWLPERISGVSTLRRRFNSTVEWSFIATYRNYHLLTVNSKILPAATLEPSPTQ